MPNVSLLLVTHNRVGRALLETAQSMLSELPFRIALLPIAQSCMPDKEVAIGLDLCQQLDNGAGILILTDAFGSTPSNIANNIAKQYQSGPVAIVAGVNLPMVLKIANYPTLPLNDIVTNAVSGGQKGIILCTTASATTPSSESA